MSVHTRDVTVTSVRCVAAAANAAGISLVLYAADTARRGCGIREECDMRLRWGEVSSSRVVVTYPVEIGSGVAFPS